MKKDARRLANEDIRQQHLSWDMFCTLPSTNGTATRQMARQPRPETTSSTNDSQGQIESHISTSFFSHTIHLLSAVNSHVACSTGFVPGNGSIVGTLKPLWRWLTGRCLWDMVLASHFTRKMQPARSHLSQTPCVAGERRSTTICAKAKTISEAHRCTFARWILTPAPLHCSRSMNKWRWYITMIRWQTMKLFVAKKGLTCVPERLHRLRDLNFHHVNI